MSKRRGHGEGSISQRKDGRWTARVDLDYVDGKRKRKQIYGKTRKEVADQLKVLLHDQQQGLPVAVERQTVAQFLDRWLADVVAPTVRSSTYHRYRLGVTKHIQPHIGRVQLTKLTPQHVQQMLQALHREGLKPAGVHIVFRILRTALNVALRWQLVPRNVATLVEPPRIEQYDAIVLTPTQAQQLLAAAQGHRLEALYRIALSLGLRKGELLGLRWEDVNLDAGTLRVTAALQISGGKPILVTSKTTRSRRTLPLSPSLIAALRQHKVRQLEERVLAGGKWQDHGLVFPSAVGTPMLPRNFSRSFHRLLARAGLPPMCFHDLRHSCATFLALQKVEPRTAMEILGHANIYTTMQVYTHTLDSAKQRAVAQMDVLLETAQQVG